jgi:hypothetical protein
VLCSEAEAEAETGADSEAKPSGAAKADAREEARRAARRLVAFGWPPPVNEHRAVEPVQDGKVVETSFAKGEWGLRWRS